MPKYTSITPPLLFFIMSCYQDVWSTIHEKWVVRAKLRYMPCLLFYFLQRMPVVSRGEREKLCLYFCVQGWFVCVRSSVTLTEKPFVSCNQVAIFTRSGSFSLVSHLWQVGHTSAAFTDLRVLLADCVFGTHSFLIRGQKKPLSNGPTCAFLYIYKPCT